MAGDAESPERTQEYHVALQELEDADSWSDAHDGLDVAERLDHAIAQILEFGPELVGDPDGRESLLYARLSLARNYYLMDPPDPAAGNAIIESVLRTTFEVSPSVEARFAPYFGDQIAQQRALLDAEGKATIEVVCHIECDVAVNHQPGAAGPMAVYLGTHAVVVTARDGSLEPTRHAVTLTKRGQVEVVEFGLEPEPETETDTGTTTEDEPAPTLEPVCPPLPAPAPAPDVVTARMLPRWAEVASLVVAAGLMAGGSVMLGVDGTEPCSGVPASDCDWLWESTPGGAIMLGIGGAVLVSSVALLAVDEHRARSRKQQRARLRAFGVLEF